MFCKVWMVDLDLDDCEGCSYLKKEVVGGKNPNSKDMLIRFCGHKDMTDERPEEQSSNGEDWRKSWQ